MSTSKRRCVCGSWFVPFLDGDGVKCFKCLGIKEE
jgi:hypothetical protein